LYLISILVKRVIIYMGIDILLYVKLFLRSFIVLLYVTFSDSGRSCYPVLVDMTTVKGNLRNSGGIPAENAP